MNENGYGGMDELLKTQRKLLRASRLRTLLLLILAAAVVLSLALVVPRVLSLSEQVGEAVGQVQQALPELEKRLEDAGTVMDNAGTMMEQSSEAMQKINSVDFARLNEAINNLADAVEPLGNLGRFFGAGGN